MKNTLKNIAYNCRKATWLIEKKQVGSLTIREKLELEVHLAGCSECRMFERHDALTVASNRPVAHKKFFQHFGVC